MIKLLLILGWLITYCKTAGYAEAHKVPDEPNGNNVFIITLDGLRWQEIFYGADSALMHNKKFTADPASVAEAFWAANLQKRRKQLMPFLWDFVATNGQLFGNRSYHNYVNVSNFYALSYPGYNEIFTGKADFTIYSNSPLENKNVTLLEYLNNKEEFAGKVASFSSWSMFSYIFNKKRSKLYIDCSNALFTSSVDSGQSTVYYKRSIEDKNIRSDYLTYTAAREYIVKNHPRVVHIGLSGTDMYAHKKRYGDYLRQANLADNIIKWLWQLAQSIPFYQNRTTFIITTDHGRGAKEKNWYKHGLFVKGSSQAWLALVGNGVSSAGEVKQQLQVYQKQLAGTIGYFLNIHSYRNHTLPAIYFSKARNRL